MSRDLGLHVTMHANSPAQVTAMHETSLLGPDLILVHCNVITDDELDLLVAKSTVSVTPGIELAFGSPFTVLGRAVRRGVRITWGCDIPRFYQCGPDSPDTYCVSCARIPGRRGGGRSGARRPGIPTLQPRGPLKSATIDAARAFGMGDRIGWLTPGKQAHIVLLRLVLRPRGPPPAAERRPGRRHGAGGRPSARTRRHLLVPVPTADLIHAARCHVVAEPPSG